MTEDKNHYPLADILLKNKLSRKMTNYLDWSDISMNFIKFDNQILFFLPFESE